MEMIQVEVGEMLHKFLHVFFLPKILCDHFLYPSCPTELWKKSTMSQWLNFCLCRDANTHLYKK